MAKVRKTICISHEDDDYITQLQATRKFNFSKWVSEEIRKNLIQVSPEQNITKIQQSIEQKRNQILGLEKQLQNQQYIYDDKLIKFMSKELTLEQLGFLMTYKADKIDAAYSDFKARYGGWYPFEISLELFKVMWDDFNLRLNRKKMNDESIKNK